MRSRPELVAENMMLRKQLVVAPRKVDKPRLRPNDRGLPWFRPIFAFFIVDVNTKRVVHIGVTRAPHRIRSRDNPQQRLR